MARRVTVGQFIQAESRTWRIDEGSVDPGITREIQDMEIYHREWARPKTAAGRILVLWAGSSERGVIVRFDADRRTLRLTDANEIQGLVFLGAD